MRELSRGDPYRKSFERGTETGRESRECGAWGKFYRRIGFLKDKNSGKLQHLSPLLNQVLIFSHFDQVGLVNNSPLSGPCPTQTTPGPVCLCSLLVVEGAAFDWCRLNPAFIPSPPRPIPKSCTICNSLMRSDGARKQWCHLLPQTPQTFCFDATGFFF